MRFTSTHFLLCCCLLFGLAWATPARADVLLKARSISTSGIDLTAVSLRLAEDASGGVHLQMQAGSASVPAMGWRRLGLKLDGTLRRDERLRWIFDGRLQLAGAPGGALSDSQVKILMSESENTLLADLLQGKAQASTALPLDQPTHARISLHNLPLGWLQGLLGTVWSGRVTGGRVDAEMALDLREKGVQSSSDFTMRGVGFDTPNGSLAGQAVSGSGRFNLDTTAGPARVELDASLHDGEVLLGPTYAQLPSHAVQISLQADADKGAMKFNRLRVNDADALKFSGSMAFDARGELSSLTFDQLHANFPAAYTRYGKVWLSTLGLQDMQVRGQLDATVDLRADGLHAFTFDTDGMDLADADGRVAVDALRGGLDWNRQGVRPATTLSWKRLRIYRVTNGADKSRWRSQGGTLSLQQPLVFPLFQGRLHIGEFDWQPAAARGKRLSTSMVLTDVDMASLGKAMGWPAFPGKLGGAIPSLQWVDDRLVLQGGLSANLFDGFADITQLSVQQPFGPDPVLNADILLHQMDLGAITSVFDFGGITGRLDGSIEDLQLVNWNPVAFKARLLAGSGGRISQRAVNNLTSVGGGGIAAGLQGAVLKLFKTFGYSRIGLNCTLQATICRMSGLEPNDGGYTIVEGSGLPRLQVIGHQSQVDWPILVRRLHEAINGTAPQVR